MAVVTGVVADAVRSTRRSSKKDGGLVIDTGEKNVVVKMSYESALVILSMFKNEKVMVTTRTHVIMSPDGKKVLYVAGRKE